ncbi:tyrosine-type recombinase/integrase [Veronia nyctiphanis]|uniref:tyrosine-type recombinase/integrase n=1 Tax=Veronia nyctiphanis TaxID=1278244 RepID=UPI002E269259
MTSLCVSLKSPSAYFTVIPFNHSRFSRVCEQLGIEDLNYHDLRREGASRLFEKGFSIEEVAQVTGHRNLQTLWLVYTQPFPQKLHEKVTED